MLNKREREVLTAIIDKCRGTDNCIISVEELTLVINNKKLTNDKTQAIVNSLEYDDYLDYVHTIKGDKKLLSIRLHKKALSLKRELKQLKRTFALRLTFAALSAIVTFLFTRLLVYIFS